MIIIEVNIVDAIMGRGKTTAMINYMNSLPDDVKILYITPFLTEVNRIIESCPTKYFCQPKDNVRNSKLQGIKYLFKKGKNIVSTHSLFGYFDQETIDLAYNNNYILVMDEVADVIEEYDKISDDDWKTMTDKYVKVDKNGLVRWYAEKYDGVFEPYKKLCDLESLAIYGDERYLWLFPISTFKAFRKIYILTYMFNAQLQKYYYDYFKIKYNYLYVDGDSIDNYKLVCEPTPYEYPNYNKLIHILDNDRMNQIGDLDGSLSKTWYLRNSNNGLLKALKKNCINYFTHITQTKSQYNIWTTFKAYKSQVSGKGYTKGFVSSNIRATNSYRDKTAVAYLINKFFNPFIKNFFVKNNIEVDEDAYAVSEMLQWIWRSAIRDGKEIWIYIPSKRMRTLLQDWMNNLSKGDSNI